MSYNKIQDFDLNFTNSGNENQSKLIYLKDIQNKSLKLNNKLVFKNNATSKILSDSSENNELVKITGNLLTNKSVFSQEIIANSSLHIKKTNDLLDSNDLFKIIKNISASSIDINSYNQNKKIKISSKNQILFTNNSSNSFFSKEIVGQFINDSLGNQILKGKDGVNIEVKEKNGKKYFEIDYSSNVSNNLDSKLAYKTIIKWNGIDTTNSDKDSGNRYSFLIQSGSPIGAGPDGPTSITNLNNSRKTRLKLKLNNNYEKWSVGKHFIYIDTSEINSNLHVAINGVPTISRYEMIIDLSQSNLNNDRQWKTGDELYFYLNLQSIGQTELNKLADGVHISSTYIVSNPIYFSGTTRTYNSAVPATIGKRSILEVGLHQSNTFPSISYYTFDTTSSALQFWLPLLTDIGTTLKEGDIFLFKKKAGAKDLIICPNSTNTGAITITDKLCLKWQNGAWADVTSAEYASHIQTINYNIDSVYNRYQYVLIMPQNHRFFIDNNLSNNSKLQNSFILKRVVDTYDSVWFNDKEPGFNFIGKEKLKTITELENCVIFNPSHSQSSFSLRFLGNNDPSRPGIGTWIIR